MDSLTQIVLGAAVGEAAIGKKVGNKAILWGAIGGTIPDLDVFVAQLFDPVTQLNFHRGFSHSLVFAFLISPILGYLISKLHKKLDADWKDWTFLFLLAIGTHPILDSFTAWGTQLLLPFSNARIAWNTISVVDPLYTFPFLLLLIAAMRRPKTSAIRRKLNWAGILVSSLYLSFTIINKHNVNGIFERALAKQNIEYKQYISNPIFSNNVLWYTVVEADSSYYLGYYSYFDKTKDVEFLPIPKKHEIPESIQNHDGINVLKFISKGFYNVETYGDTINFYDLRFGLLNGITKKGPTKYTFTYVIDNTNPSVINIVAKRPDAKLDIFKTIWERLKGI